jgi:hypothetical protein
MIGRLKTPAGKNSWQKLEDFLIPLSIGLFRVLAQNLSLIH